MTPDPKQTKVLWFALAAFMVSFCVLTIQYTYSEVSVFTAIACVITVVWLAYLMIRKKKPELGDAFILFAAKLKTMLSHFMDK